MDKLPQSFIQHVCQVLTDSGNFGSVLSLRSTCSDFYKLINKSTILLSKTIAVSESEEVDDFIESLQFISESTQWKYSKLKFECQNSIKTPSLLAALGQYRKTVVDKLNYLSFESFEFDVSFLNLALELLYRPGTSVNLGRVSVTSSFRNNFKFHDIVDSLEILIDSDFPFDPNTVPVYSKCTRIKSLVIYNSSFYIDTHGMILSQLPPLEFLQELCTDVFDVVLNSLPNSSLPFFPSVKKLEILNWNGTILPDAITRHFPSLEVLRCEDSSRHFQSTEITEMNYESSCFPATCRTLYVSASLLHLCHSLRNVQELHVLFGSNTQMNHQGLIELLLKLLSQATLTVLNVRFHWEIYPLKAEFLCVAEVLEFCGDVLRAQPQLKVLSVRGMYQLNEKCCSISNTSKGAIQAWREKNEDLLDRSELKLFIFGEKVVELKHLDFALMARMDYLDDELLWTVKNYTLNGKTRCLQLTQQIDSSPDYRNV